MAQQETPDHGRVDIRLAVEFDSAFSDAIGTADWGVGSDLPIKSPTVAAMAYIGEHFEKVKEPFRNDADYRFQLPSGSWIRVTVSDDGPGSWGD